MPHPAGNPDQEGPASPAQFRPGGLPFAQQSGALLVQVERMAGCRDAVRLWIKNGRFLRHLPRHISLMKNYAPLISTTILPTLSRREVAARASRACSIGKVGSCGPANAPAATCSKSAVRAKRASSG